MKEAVSNQRRINSERKAWQLLAIDLAWRRRHEKEREATKRANVGIWQTKSRRPGRAGLVAGGSSSPTHDTEPDTPGNPRPMARKLPGQRLVAIDPGRRDINYVKTEEAHETPSTCTSSTSKILWLSQFFGISTRQHVKEAKRRRIATVTIELQKRTLLSAEVFWGVDLQA